MKKSYDVENTSSFIKGINSLTGIAESKLKKYAAENNLFNVLEHPNTIEPNKQQLEKINILNEFISTYRILKLQENENKEVFNSPAVAGEYFVSLLSSIKDREKFMVAFLDSGHNLIEIKTISEGAICEVVVYPRMILKLALDCDCKAILLAHNHPGGNLFPSTQDQNLTSQLLNIFSPLEINVLDHIIIAGSNYYSMLEKGTMPQVSKSISPDAIPLDDHKKVEEGEIDFMRDTQDTNNMDISDYEFLEPDYEDELEL